MKVLVACEFSQVVTKAFRDRGHEAYSCDLLPTEGNPDWHFQGDVRNYLYDWFDLLIAHPPCTRLANSGVCWLEKRNLWKEMAEGAEFLRMFLIAPIKKICVENPIPHHYATDYIGRSYDQIIQPWQFGHPESKATCLWLNNLPKLIPTDNVKDEMMKLPMKERQRNHWVSPGKNRGHERSRFYTGFAEAMADQWGSL